SVAVVSEARGVSRAATTDQLGTFRVPLLTPGEWGVRVEAHGFAPYLLRLPITVGEIAVVDVQLDLGTLMTDTAVSASPAMAELRRTQQANAVDAGLVANLPNIHRDFTPYVLILPGVSDPEAPRAQFAGMAWPTTGFAVGGANGHAN